MTPTLTRLAVAVPVLVLAFLLNLNGTPLFDVDEGAFSAASREMILSHDFIAITLNGEPRFDKPVLIYWLQSLSALTFGNETWAYRLPSALAAIAWGWLIYWFTAARLGARAGTFALLLFATSLQVGLIGKAATADALLNLFICASGFMLFRYLEEGRRSDLYLMAGAIALAVLTKGPIGILVPGAVGFVYCLVSPGRWRNLFSIPLSPVAWAIFLAITLPWPVMLIAREGTDFFREFIMVHNVGRFSDSMEGHSGSPLYYVIALLVGFLPHSAVLLVAMWHGVRDRQDPFNRFALVWFGFIFVFFTLSATKLPHYLMYGSGGLFVLMAAHIGRIRQRWWLFLPQIAFAALLGALPWLLSDGGRLIGDPVLATMLEGDPDIFGLGYVPYLAVFLLVSIYFAFDRRIALVTKQVISGLALTLFLSFYLFPAAGELQQRQVVRAAEVAAKLANPLVQMGIHMPSFNVYAGRPSEQREPVPGDLVFLRSSKLEDLPPHVVLFNERGVALAGIEPFQPQDAK